MSIHSYFLSYFLDLGSQQSISIKGYNCCIANVFTLNKENTYAIYAKYIPESSVYGYSVVVQWYQGVIGKYSRMPGILTIAD